MKRREIKAILRSGDLDGDDAKAEARAQQPTQRVRLAADVMQASRVPAQDLPSGALYVVATPIGNLADITLRALWVLAHADAIAAEDTRVTRALLARYEIDVPVFAAHQHNERAAAEVITARLARGERVALVTDAGTPAVSDPGALIVRAVLAAGHRVVPVPGASSALAALMTAGIAGGGFEFIGFLPSGARERKRRLATAAAAGTAFVAFEAPHRVRVMAAELAAVLAPNRRIVLARELTKTFETVFSTTAGEFTARLAGEPERGEFVIVVDSANTAADALEMDAAALRWLRALAAELPAARAAAVAAKATGRPRAELYRVLLAVEGRAPGDD